jgi:signal transduction histidine kinase/ActR/RegA family two-component response regulator
MLKRISHFFFKKPDEIGLDNYLVLVFSFISAILGFAGTIINLSIGLLGLPIICTLSTSVIFTLLYFVTWRKECYKISKYIIIISGIVLLNIQWFINYGSTGPILYLFVLLESFILVFFTKKEKVIFSIIVFANVTALFYIEYQVPDYIGKYETNSARLIDIYTGLLIYLFLSILLINAALKFYIKQKENAQLADKLKSSFLANMSHEIRTPMNGILGFAEILKEPNLTGEQQRECINIIEKSGTRMLSIINDIIDISKIESGLMKTEMKASNINDQIEYLYTFFKPETDKKGIRLSKLISLSNQEAIIMTDPEKLYAILINLVKNAIKYTQRGSIDFGYIKKTYGEFAELEFFVKDTGIGIPGDRHEAIFERFVQADINDRQAYQGAGLGLSIAKAYVEMLGGKIRVESETGKGSNFYFTIPYNNESIIETAIPPSVNYVEFKNLKILIVEDDEASEMLLTREVSQFCRELLTVKSGPAAIEMCRNNPDIDLVFMDIQIPGMDGNEATMEIRKFNKNVVIIAQTAYALTGDREKSILAGCNDYLAKPISRTALKTMMEQYVQPGKLHSKSELKTV